MKNQKELSNTNSLTFMIITLLFMGNSLLGQSDGESHMSCGDSLINIGDHAAASVEFEKAAEIFISQKSWDEAIESLSEYAYCNNSTREFQNTIIKLRESFPILKNNGNAEKFMFAKLLIHLGYAYRWENDYLNSLTCFEEAISIYQKNKTNHANVAYAYRFAGQNYVRRLNYKKAINYYEKALTVDSTAAYHASLYALLSSTYNFIEDYDKALHYTQLGLELKSKKKLYNQSLYTTQADSWKGKERYDLAEKNYLQAIKLNQNSPSGIENEINLYISISDLYCKINNYEKCDYFLEKAKSLVESEIHNKNRATAKLYVAFGEMYSNKNEHNKSLNNYQQALIQVFPNFNSTDISDNPKIEDVYTESWIMTASARKGEALLARFEKEANIDDLKNAAECFDLSMAGIQKLKESYGSDKAKLYLGDYSHNYFEEAISVNFLLHEKTGEPQYLEKAFSIMEKSKASVLEEGIQNNRALILAGIPDSLLLEEENIRLNLADLDNRIKSEELKEEESDYEYISKLRSQYVDEQRNHESLLNYMKSTFPQFNEYTKKTSPPTINKIKEKIKKNDAGLLEYFAGEKHLYIVSILPTGNYFHRIEIPDETVDSFLGYFKNSTAILNDVSSFSGISYQLYGQLFPEEIRKKIPYRLIIIPSGKLNYVPFDALMPKGKSGEYFSINDFLLKSHLIHFHYSAGLWLGTEFINSGQHSFLSISPMFKKNERSLAALSNETINFSEFQNTVTLSDQEATLNAFRNFSNKSRFIHLFTHAGAGENEEAKIEFIDTSLYISDLYAMKIPAELATLSACETGLGKYEKGEGVMSLARGFAYAGTSNLIASLWQVNEKSTADIFNLFYENIAEGVGKAEALRSARIKYFENVESDVKKSPYYWAGFVLIGDNEPIEIKKKTPVWVWGGGAVAIISIIFLLSKRKKTSPKVTQ